MNNLPREVERCLETFVEDAKRAFGADLVSIVLFGSAAAGELRATSDVNLLLVLKRFRQDSADRLRGPMRLAMAAVQMHAMFLLETEVAPALDAFAVKFADILTRNHLLFGADPFVNLHVSRDALSRRVKQVLLNLQLRLRERYIAVSLREEQLAYLIADAAPPLRSSAASLLQLEGKTVLAGKAALEQVVAEMADHMADHMVDQIQLPELKNALLHMSQAREQGQLPAGVAVPTLMALIQLTEHLRERAEKIQ